MRKKIAVYLIGTCMLLTLAAGCGKDEAPVQPSTGNTAGTTVTPTTPSGAAQADNAASDGTNAAQSAQNQAPAQSQPASQGNITAEQAKEIALKRAGVSEKDTISLVVKPEIEDGVSIFEVDIYTPDKDFEYEILTADGSIYEEDIDIPNRLTSTPVQTGYSLDNAKKAVLAKVPGASEKNLRMELEHDDGRYEYEGEIIFNNTSYEFEMDAQNGTIYKWEADSLFD